MASPNKGFLHPYVNFTLPKTRVIMYITLLNSTYHMSVRCTIKSYKVNLCNFPQIFSIAQYNTEVVNHNISLVHLFI